MKPKEIDNIVYEKLGSFLKEQGFKTVKKRSGFSKIINNITFNIVFTNLDKRPEYDYSFILGVFIQEVGDIDCRADGREEYIGKFSGYTYVLPFSYFINPDDYIQKNPEWIISNEADVYSMITDVKDFYEKHLDTFIQNHSTLETFYHVMEKDIDTGKAYTIDENVFARSLIILKLLKSNKFESKLTEYREKLQKSGYDKSMYIDMFNYIEKL
ncbi:hypothetical protein Q4599_17425 [Cellulophaga lytica]|uniref:hypothetical protein n=1 Tax=Cellulophaga lytica TaxID=979 RepID=UPI0009505035|nr:hypothetical protein [Cellulophaga lytica]APU09452.1 hypothetical protein A5M85_03885 [Cellulophaga lytica]MDO6855355.1 hypothetical protein [Cellulophaga lytica]